MPTRFVVGHPFAEPVPVKVLPAAAPDGEPCALLAHRQSYVGRDVGQPRCDARVDGQQTRTLPVSKLLADVQKTRKGTPGIGGRAGRR